MSALQVLALVASCGVAAFILFGGLFLLASFVGKFFNGLVDDE